MTRGGTDKDRSDGPERQCIVTRDSLPMSAMIRFVVGPDEQIVPDILRKLPGRGIWVTANKASLEQAATKNLFARAAKAPVKVPENLVGEIEAQVTRRLIDLISLARKSGSAVAGYEKVKSWLGNEEATVLIQASDGSERGKSKLSTPHYGTFIGWLTADELGLAFGRQTVIHAALSAGGLTSRVVEEAQRLRSIREISDGRGRPKGKDS